MSEAGSLASSLPVDVSDDLVVIDEWRDSAIDILIEVADSMTGIDVQVALDRLVVLALRATMADRCAVFVLDEERVGILRPAAADARIGDIDEQRERFRTMEPIKLEGRFVLNRLRSLSSAVTIEDAQGSKIIPEKWRNAWGSKSVAFAPLLAGGEVYGLLAVDFVAAMHRFRPGEARLLGAIAAGAGASLRQARLVEQLHRSIQVREKLAECAAAVQSGRSLDEVLDLIVDRFTSLIPSSTCRIGLLNQDDALEFSSHTEGYTSSLVLGEDRIDAERLQRLWRGACESPTNASGAVADTRESASTRSRGILVPLSEAGELIGVIEIGRPGNGERLSDDEKTIAVAFADQASIAIRQARLKEALKSRLRVIEALYRLSSVVARTTDLKVALTSINDDLGREAGTECVSVAFADRQLCELLRARAPSPSEARLLGSWQRQQPPVPQALGEGYGVPIMLSGRVVGILRTRQSGQLDSSGFEFMRAVADGLGQVALKAKLRRTAESRAQELAVAAERERIARDLHDTVGQTFYGIGLKLQDLLSEVPDPELAERLSDVRALAAQAVGDVRSAVYALSFLHVRAKGLLASIRRLAKQFTKSTGVYAKVSVNGKLPRLSEDVVSALFRVTHEALVNVDRHARATGVVISLDCDPEQVKLVIRDDGVGLDNRQVSDWRSAAHFGMRTMARVIDGAGGRFKVKHSQPRGLVIEATVPTSRRAGHQRRRATR